MISLILVINEEQNYFRLKESIRSKDDHTILNVSD